VLFRSEGIDYANLCLKIIELSLKFS